MSALDSKSVANSKWWHLRYAADVMKQGGVIAYPTETVWGLGCDPNNEDAVRRILEIKQRPESKGLILISGNPSQLASLLEPLSKDLREKFLQPRAEPTTWLVPDPEDQVPSWVKGKFSAAAVRLTSYDLIQGLTRAFGGPVVSTSANRAGQPPAKDKLHLKKIFGDELDYILPAALGGYAKPSTIRDLNTDSVVRV